MKRDSLVVLHGEDDHRREEDEQDQKIDKTQRSTFYSSRASLDFDPHLLMDGEANSPTGISVEFQAADTGQKETLRSVGLIAIDVPNALIAGLPFGVQTISA